MFFFGLVVGLVIGSVIAVLVYHNNKAKFDAVIDKAAADIDKVKADAKIELDAAKAEVAKLKQQIEDLLAPKSQSASK